jgi:hypothetical protein
MDILQKQTDFQSINQTLKANKKRIQLLHGMRFCLFRTI